MSILNALNKWIELNKQKNKNKTVVDDRTDLSVYGDLNSPSMSQDQPD